MRTLALISDAFGGHGGIAKFNRDLLKALCVYTECKEVVAIPRLVQNSIEPIPSKLTYVTEGLNGKWKYLATTLKYITIRKKFDLVVCGHVNLMPIAFLAKIIVRAPLLLFMHGIDVWQPTKNILTNYIVRYTDGFVSVSNLTKDRFLDWARVDAEKGFILPNTIDFDQFKPGKKPSNLLDRYGLRGKKVLMTLGRLVSKERCKGFDQVLELLPDMTRDDSGISYLIAGDGADRRRLEEKVRSLGIGNFVRFAGLIPESEKVDHYRLADVYVMPSRGEGFGIVFLEAMACGIPVVASKVDGGREALRDGKLGILVDPDKPAEIKTGILGALKRGSGMVPKGLDYFSYRNFEQRCHRIIDQVMTGKIVSRSIRP